MVADFAPSSRLRPRSMCAAPTYTLPSLSSELLAWTPNHTLLTPPPSAHDQFPPPNMLSNKPILPPITYIERHLAAPPTPPYSSRQAHLDRQPPLPFYDDGLRTARIADTARSHTLSPVRRQIDWYGSSFAPGSRALVEKTCEMICYLWFSEAVPRNSSPPPTPVVSNLQLAPSHVFVQFMQKVLETTQVSASVVVLSLHYIRRLRERNHHVRGQPGSEFRVSIAGLMLANKFLDDNTYTNKTWSEVSGVSLSDITRAEYEFLRGLDYALYIDKDCFEAWERALKGLVLAQERARREHERVRASRAVFNYGLPPLHSPSRHAHTTRRSVSSFPRARSTSPHRARLPALYIPPSGAASTTSGHYASNASQPTPMVIDPAAANAGAKRSAADAFSPTPSPCDWRRASKRPTSMLLELPPVTIQQESPPGSAATSPLESLNGFAELSLIHAGDSLKANHVQSMPRTLVAPYRMDSSNQPVAPQNLYYYALSGSPSDPSTVEDGYSRRKGRLQYHQTSTLAPFAPVARYPVRVPPIVQSARTSPHEDTRNTLPPLLGGHDFGYYRDARSDYPEALPPVTLSAAAPPAPSYVRHEARRSPGGVPSAPFANAGPSGFDFYGATASAPHAVPGMPAEWWQYRGRPIYR